MPEREKEPTINWIFTSSNSNNDKNGINVELLKFTPTVPDPVYRNSSSFLNLNFKTQIKNSFLKAHVDFEAILVYPENKNDTFVVFPHGESTYLMFKLKYF